MREVAEQGWLALSRQHEIDQTRHMRARLVGREQCAAVRHTSLSATVSGHHIEEWSERRSAASLVRRGTEMAGRIWLPRGVFISAGRRGGLMLPVYAAAGIGRGFGRDGRLRMFVAPIHATAGIGVDFDRRICRRRGSRRRCRAGRR